MNTKTAQTKRTQRYSTQVISLFFFLNFGLTLASAAERKSDFEAQMLQIANDEFNSARVELEKELSTVQAKVADVEKAKQRAKEASVALANSEEKGIEFLNKYSQLIKLKYLDKMGNFEAKAALSEKDVQNINSVFNNYLRTVPFSGRASAGIAVRQLEKGLDLLKQNISMHSKPDVENNSDMAILTKEEETHHERIKVIQALLSRFPEAGRKK